MTRAPVPRRLPAAVSLFAGVAAVALVAGTPGQLAAVGVDAVGALAVAVGLGWRHRGRAALGTATAAAGGLLSLVGVALPVALGLDPARILGALGGLLALPVLALGLGPLVGGRERGFVTAGSALSFLGVLGAGVLHGAGTLSLLVAAVAAVLAWDAGEQAVNLAEQVGTEATAVRAALVHPSASAAVGGVGVALALAANTLDVTGVPLPVLLALLAAGGLTALALSH